ncbi:MAG: acyloxyacyl hydrolase [Nitrospirota bacterium]
MLGRLCFFLSALLLCCSNASYGDEILLEGGRGFHQSNHSEVFFLRYQKDSSPLFGLDSYYGLAAATWSGTAHNSAIILTKGIRFDVFRQVFAGFEGGGAYLKRTTRNLGTRLQFALRAFTGVRIESFDVGIGYNHFSNGKGVFGWTKTANHGENFVTLQVGYRF